MAKKIRRNSESVIPSPSSPLLQLRGGDDLRVFLDLALNAPHDAGIEQAARLVLEAFHEVMPHRSLALRLQQASRIWVETLIPEDRPPAETHRDRLFAGEEEEIIVQLDVDADDCSLHVAGEARQEADPQLDRLLEDGAKVATALITRALDRSNGDDTRSSVIAKLRGQLAQAEKLASLGRVVAGVAHEVASPLTAILAYADYLKKKAREPEGSADHIDRLERIGAAAEHVRKFAKDLLVFARPTHAPHSLLSIHDVLEQSLALADGTISQESVIVVREYASLLPQIPVDLNSLTQVFVNLLTNACHAMSPLGGKLTIRTRLLQQEVEIAVEDEGTGIDEAVFPRIFEPFVSTKTRGGTGLGLAICRDIIQAHNGTIFAENRVPRGARFVVRFPIEPESKPAS